MVFGTYQDKMMGLRLLFLDEGYNVGYDWASNEPARLLSQRLHAALWYVYVDTYTTKL